MIVRAFVLLTALSLGACASVPDSLFHPLEPAAAGPHVTLHYLGNGGWLIQRDQDRIATAPFVSNPSALTLLLPRGPNTALIDEVIPPMPDVWTILVGHGHYDHAMDLPYVATTKARNAKIYGSTTVVNTLGAVPELDGRLSEIKASDAASGDRPGRWITDATGRIRFMPLRSTHAPHFAGLKLIPWWTVDEKQTRLPCCPYWWKEGQTYAFIIDFLDAGGNVDFRIYYQDAATRPGTGIVPVFEGRDAARVDVAILCVAAFDQVDGNPEHILTNVQPRTIVGGHWEDFFFHAYKDRPVRPAFGTSLESFYRRARAVSSSKIYLPEPGQKLSIPIEPRR